MRSRKKLLDKVNWYRKKPKEDLYEKKHGKKRRQEDARNKDEPERPQAKSVLFIEQTNQGELGKRLRELLTRASPSRLWRGLEHPWGANSPKQVSGMTRSVDDPPA